MNGAYLHLLVNHVPVVGVPIGFFLLLAGLLKKSRDLIQAGLVALVILALVTIVAFKSGGPAAHVLMHNVEGIERASIHLHAEAADYAFITMNILGAAALLGFILSLRASGCPTILTVLILLGALDASVCFARVAHLGGLIRHPEIEAMGEKKI